MPTQTFTRAEFAASVKAKYPEYAPVPDDELVDKVLAKYPEYRSHIVDFKSTATPATEPTIADRALDLLPTVGGMAGGVIGGIGGTVLGTPVGGVPGAIGGATLGGAFGESMRQLGHRLKGDAAPATMTDAAKNVALEGGIQGGSELVGQGFAAALPVAGRMVYRGYLKPSLAASEVGKAQTIVNTAIDEALPIARAGTEKAQRLIGTLRHQVTNILQASPEKVDLHAVADQVRTWARGKYFRPGADMADFKAAMAVAENIDQHASLGLAPGIKVTKLDVPLSVADATKRTLDESIGDTSFGIKRGAETEAQKFGRSRLRVALEAKAPEVGPLNARESKLIDAGEAILKAVEREANQNPLYGVKSMASTMLGAAGYEAGGLSAPIALAGTIATRFALQPQVASRAAIVAERLAREFGVSVATAMRIGARVALQESQHNGNQDSQRK